LKSSAFTGRLDSQLGQNCRKILLQAAPVVSIDSSTKIVARFLLQAA